MGGYVKQFVEEHICDDIDLLISGHDHNQQHLKPTHKCGNTEFIVTGAGARTKPLVDTNRNPSYWQNGDTPGFFHIQIVANQMTITAYTVAEDADIAVEQHRRTIKK